MGRPTKIIDVHAHIFNLNYMPLQGIIMAHGVNRYVALGVDRILKALVGDRAVEGLTSSRFYFDEDAPDFDQKLITSEKETIIKEFALRTDVQTYESPEVWEAFRLMGIEEEDVENEEGFVMTPEVYTTVIIPRRVEKFLLKVFNMFESLAEYLRWFLIMTLSETKLITKLIESYSAVDQFVFHMMDTDNFFHGRPKFSSEDARSRMSEFLRLYPEKLIGFIAYDPNKGVRELIPFLEDGLFKGIKFYPPMGYNAISNNNSAWNDNNRELFTYCCEKKIPVFAHCTPTGFEAIPEITGRNSDPHFWYKLLNQDEFENLYLCLGHAGGVEGWFEPFEEASIFGRPTDGGKFFSEKVYELCTNFPNVYCEFGFLDHIHDPDQYNNFKQRLEFLFKKDETEAVKYRFRDKIMYGSDWHILFNHGIQLNYEKPYLNLFKEGIIGDYSEEFFNGNALKYLRPKNRSY